jgi:DinB superfamily
MKTNKPMRSLSNVLFRFCLAGVLLVPCVTDAQSEPAPGIPTLKSVLLEQLRSTHNKEEWFVPVNIAIQGLTAEQAAWKDNTENHSIAQLVNHLIFWNQQQLAKFKGEKPPAFNGDNKETFSGVDKTSWETSVKKLDEVLTAWEKAIEQADEAKLTQWYTTIGRISTHNAYHTGQIIYIRKMKGNWDAEKGVK